MVTINELGSLIKTTSSAAQNPIAATASFLDNKIGSKGLGGSGLGAQDLFNFVQNPTPQNMLNTAMQMPAISNLPFAQGLNQAMNFMQNPSAENAIKTGAQAAATGALTAAIPALAGPVGLLAAPVVSAAVQGGLNIAKDLGRVFTEGFNNVFSGPQISKDQEALDRQLVEDNLNPDELSSSGGDSIAKIQKAISDIAEGGGSNQLKQRHVNHIRCLIVEMANKSDEPQKKILMDLANSIESNNHDVMGMMKPNMAEINKAFDKFASAYSPSGSYNC
jgi:hypothetical protein